MYEHMTFDYILQRCLDRIPDSLDKREGSIIYDALAPAAAELAQLYIELDTIMERVFPDTATGEDLTKLAMERGIIRLPASYALRKGMFTDSNGNPKDIPIGSRFSGGEVNYVAVEKLDAGVFAMRCETAGSIGNAHIGYLSPIDYIPDLGSATLSDILVPGEDEETDEALRQRYMQSIRTQPFGGNIADYKYEVSQIYGVGGCKVIPAWQGGGTVKVVIIDSLFNVPSAQLIATVQNTLDPPPQGTGLGTAPIGHTVTVTGVIGVTIDISFALTLASGYSWGSVSDAVSEAIEQYLLSLRQTWADVDYITVRKSYVETAILGVDGVLDVTDVKLNGTKYNVELNYEQIPLLGEINNVT